MADASDDQIGDEAPFTDVPWTTFVNVEHPGVVKNIDYAIASLGGASRLASFLNDPPEHQVISCKLRPEDAFRSGIPHSTAEVSDIVLRIRVPKRTGRKRKRGSTDAFELHSTAQVSRQEMRDTTEFMLRSLCDCSDRAQCEPVGVVDESHRFRRLPDFQFSMMTSNMAKRLTRHILPFNYESLKQFTVDCTTHGLQDDMDLIPPPSFAPLELPFHYHYMDNPNATIHREAVPDGKGPDYDRLSHMQLVQWDVLPEQIPKGPSKSLIPADRTLEHVQILIRRLREECFSKRKVMTRRVALNFLGLSHNYDLKLAAPYVCYMFRSGPFRDCYITFGFDPRLDPETRLYQALSFKIPTRTSHEGRARGKNVFHRSLKTMSDDPNSRIFDGETLHTDGKVWQVCDITDPVLFRILQAKPRPECDIKSDGWIFDGTLGKIRTIMKHKIDGLAKDDIKPDEFYEPLLAIPDEIPDEYQLPLSRSTDDNEVVDLALSIKTVARSAARIPYTLEMLKTGAKVPISRRKSDLDGNKPPGIEDDDDDERDRGESSGQDEAGAA